MMQAKPHHIARLDLVTDTKHTPYSEPIAPETDIIYILLRIELGSVHIAT